MAQEHESQMEDGSSSRLHSLKESLDNLADESFPDIYRVPKELHAGNEQYYRPTTISIGPLHANNPSLTAEVKLKKRALKFFLSHLRETVTLDGLIDLLKEREGAARKCYNADEIQYLGSDEFVEMMLLDGCFILALILIDVVGFPEGVDSVFMGRARGPLWYSIQEDLLLLENQLPFFVLEALWKATPCSRMLIEAAVLFFRGILPGQSDYVRIIELNKMEMEMEKEKEKEKEMEMEIGMKEEMPKHLLELVLFTLFPPPTRRWNEKYAIDIYSLMNHPKNVSELALYGIKLKSMEDCFLTDVTFSNGVLKIPTLVIQESTTSLFKNLLALEQSQKPKRSCFTSYLFLMDALVDTDKDIDRLLQAGVLKTWLNDKQALVSLLSGLNTDLVFSLEDMEDFKDIYVGLQYYCRSHEVRASLMRNYYASRWDILNSILIFIFTVTQTVFSVLSYNPRK